MLDENKPLTLPNGECLNLPPNVRIMFEVEYLRYATVATVSRCGMIWFGEDVVEPPVIYRQYLDSLAAVPLDAEDDEASGLTGRRVKEGADGSSIILTSQKQIATILEPYFSEGELAGAALEYASGIEHIMDFTEIRALNTPFSLLNKTVRNILEYNSQHSDFPLSAEQVEQYDTKRLLISIIWAFSGEQSSTCAQSLGTSLAKGRG